MKKESTQHDPAHKRHMQKIWGWIIALAVVALVMGIFLYIDNLPPPVGKYDAFASCIASSGATFYGAFWCPHCAAQKAEFGSSVHLLPYHECSTPDGNSELQSCVDAGVQGYPTWVFANGTRATGVQTLQDLASSTGCALPE